MLTDTSIKKCLEKYYREDLPVDEINLSKSLLGRVEFSPDYKARLIIQILYLDGSLKREYITAEGCDAIHSGHALRTHFAH